MTATRGLFIVIEGLDKVGKTTQCVKLQQRYGVDKALLLKFPNRETACGSAIDAHLRKEKILDPFTAMNLFTQNRWEMNTTLEYTLKTGQTVIADRYAMSGVAYAMANGIPYEYAKTGEVGLVKPDMIIFLTSSTTESRSGFGDELYERKSFQSKVSKNFEYMMKVDTMLHPNHKWIKIDTDGKDEDAVFKEIIDHIGFEQTGFWSNLVSSCVAGGSNKLRHVTMDGLYKLWV